MSQPRKPRPNPFDFVWWSDFVDRLPKKYRPAARRMFEDPRRTGEAARYIIEASMHYMFFREWIEPYSDPYGDQPAGDRPPRPADPPPQPIILPNELIRACMELGLPATPGPTIESSRAAWLKLLKIHHPDRNRTKGATERTKRINQAYRILKNYGWAE